MRRETIGVKMWGTRKMLLATFLCTLLSFTVLAEAQDLLDMAPDAVDYQYDGCRDKAMEKFIKSGLLSQELDGDERFKKAWTASENCEKLISGGIKEHTTALLALVNGDLRFKMDFNNAVKTQGANVSTYEKDFHFKVLHFLLMDSMKLIQKLNPKQCRTVYLLLEGQQKLQVGSKVRLGKFITATNSFTDLKDTEDFEGNVIFKITSCFSVHLHGSVCSQDEHLILLSPAEVFDVKNVTKMEDTENDSEYTEIVLEHNEMSNSHNCIIFSRSPAVVSAHWLLLGLVVLPLFL